MTAAVRVCRSCDHHLITRGQHDAGHVGLVHAGRSLCHRCHHRHRINGTLDQYPPLNHRSADTVEEWAFLAGQGESLRGIAHILRMTPAAVERAVYRAGHSPAGRAA